MWKTDMENIKKISHSKWQTYEGLKGSSQALRRANNALYTAIRWGRKTIDGNDLVDSVKVGQKCHERVSKVLSRLGYWGFQDTDPQCELCYMIEWYIELPSCSVER